MAVVVAGLMVSLPVVVNAATPLLAKMASAALAPPGPKAIRSVRMVATGWASPEVARRARKGVFAPDIPRRTPPASAPVMWTMLLAWCAIVTSTALPPPAPYCRPLPESSDTGLASPRLEYVLKFALTTLTYLRPDAPISYRLSVAGYIWVPKLVAWEAKLLLNVGLPPPPALMSVSWFRYPTRHPRAEVPRSYELLAKGFTEPRVMSPPTISASWLAEFAPRTGFAPPPAIMMVY